MIESVLRLFQKDPLWQNKLKTNVAHLTLNEVRQLTHLANVLAPLADLTEKLQKELGNLGMILPAVTEIKSLLTNDGTHRMGIAAFAETLKHPRFKAEWIIRDGSVSNKLGEIRQLLIEETVAKRYTPEADTPSAGILHPEPEMKKVRLFGSYFSEQQRIPGDAKAEIEMYLSSPRQNPDAEVIQFWKENTKSFPRLAKVARTVFSIPSGSASVERVFSAAGLLSTNHRMSLKPPTLAKLVFLKVNSKEL